MVDCLVGGFGVGQWFCYCVVRLRVCFWVLMVGYCSMCGFVICGGLVSDCGITGGLRWLGCDLLACLLCCGLVEFAWFVTIVCLWITFCGLDL